MNEPYDSKQKACDVGVPDPAVASEPDSGDGRTEDHRPRGAVCVDAPAVPGYRVLREIARGGMGRVLAAIEIGLDRDVALKVLLPGANPERFVRESKITARLPHPGIPPVHALGELADGSPFLAMKLVQGQTLSAAMKTFDRSRLVAIFTQVCQAVGFAHSRGIIHRDLKPANIMVGKFGEVHVMDWGLAKGLADHESCDRPSATRLLTTSVVGSEDQTVDQSGAGQSTDDQTQAGTVLGTPAYMAPEQARGEAVDARSDVFGLGAILLAILTGKPPFSGATAGEVIQKAAAGDLTEAMARLDGCGEDAELVSLCRNCLSPKPGNRPSDGQAVADGVSAHLESVQKRLQAAEHDKAVTAAREVEQGKRRRVMNSAIVAVLAVLLVGASVAGWQWQRAQSALKRVTLEKQNTTDALDDLTASRNRNLANLRSVTERLVSDRMQRQAKLSESDRRFIKGLLPMWKELGSARGDSAEGQAIQAEGHFQVAFLQERLGIRDEAATEFGRSLELWAALAEAYPENAVYRKELAHTHNSLGLLLRDLGKLPEAETHFRASLSDKKKLADAFPENVEYGRDLAGAYNNLGRLLGVLERFDDVAKEYKLALDIRAKLAAEFPSNHEVRRDLAESHNNLGILSWQLGRKEESLRHFKESLAVAQQLAADFPKIEENRLLVAQSQNNLGKLYWLQSQYEESEASFRQSLAVRQKLVDDHPGTVKYADNLAAGYFSLGGIMAQRGKLEEAEKLYRLALVVNERLVADNEKTPAYRRDWANTLRAIGGVVAKRGSRDSGLKDCRKGVTVLQELVKEYPAVPGYRRELGDAYFDLACILAQGPTKASKASKEDADQAVAMLQEAVKSGFRNAEAVTTDPNLAMLRERADFQSLVANLQKGNPSLK